MSLFACSLLLEYERPAVCRIDFLTAQHTHAHSDVLLLPLGSHWICSNIILRKIPQTLYNKIKALHGFGFACVDLSLSLSWHGLSRTIK